MKTLNKVKMSIWINALSAIVIGILFLQYLLVLLLLLQELLILFIILVVG